MKKEDEIPFLKSTEVKPLREKLHKEQNEICPICNEVIPYNEIALDHQHKLFKDQELIKDGNGMIRGVICRGCNSWEGRSFNAHRRYGLHKKEMGLPDLYRSLADYLEQPNLPYIHHTEKPKAKNVSKRNYNLLKKHFLYSEKKAKFPDYPKSGKLTIKLKKIFDEFNINPYNS